jgi:hypothetical protein
MTVLRCWWLVLMLTSPVGLAAMEGLPVTRFYPFEEIGNVSRGAHLNFDVFGRIAVVQRGTYAVLNDNTWLELAESDAADVQILETRADKDGVTYYGALGSWGILATTATGKLRADPLVPADYPKWVLATNFDQILCTPQGVYFAGLNGVVFWSRATKRHRFFEVPGGVSCVFPDIRKKCPSWMLIGKRSCPRMGTRSRTSWSAGLLRPIPSAPWRQPPTADCLSSTKAKLIRCRRRLMTDSPAL